VCPECGTQTSAALAGASTGQIRRVVRGLAMLSHTPVMVGIVLLALAARLGLQLFQPGGLSQIDLDQLIGVTTLLVGSGAAFVWLSGWIAVATPLSNERVSGRSWMRESVRAFASLGRIAILFAVGFAVAMILLPPSLVVAFLCLTVAIGAVGLATLGGLWLLDDLARRLAMRAVRGRARRARVVAIAMIVAVAVVVSFMSPYEAIDGSLGDAHFVFKAIAALGALWLVGDTAEIAAALHRGCIAAMERRAGKRYRPRSHRLLWRAGNIIRRISGRR